MGDRTLASASGVKLVQRGHQILVVDMRTGWAYTAGFVCALLCAILGIAGLVIAVAGRLVVPALALLTVAAVSGFCLWSIVKLVRARNVAPPEALAVLAVFDVHHQTAGDGWGHPLAPLSEVSLRRRSQLASSAAALELHYEGGKIELVRGNPFAGGIDAIEQALRENGVGGARARAPIA